VTPGTIKPRISMSRLRKIAIFLFSGMEIVPVTIPRHRRGISFWADRAAAPHPTRLLPQPAVHLDAVGGLLIKEDEAALLAGRPGKRNRSVEPLAAVGIPCELIAVVAGFFGPSAGSGLPPAGCRQREYSRQTDVDVSTISAWGPVSASNRPLAPSGWVPGIGRLVPFGVATGP